MKDEHNEFYSNRSKQNPAKYHSMSANSPKQLSSAPHYNLIVKKQTHTTVYPSLNSLAFQADPNKIDMMRKAFWMNRRLYLLRRCAHFVLPVVMFNASAQVVMKALIKYLEKELMVTS